MPIEESQIKWEEFLSGNNDAYSWIYRTYIQTLYGYGMRFTPDTEIIKDCIQDLFASLYRNRERLATPDNVKLYLFVSLKNNLIKALYKEDRYTRYSSEMTSFALDATVEEQFITDEQHKQLQKRVEEILSTLAPRQKEIIYYRYIQEFTFDQICQIMDLNYQSAQNLIQRAMKRIKELNTKVIFL